MFSFYSFINLIISSSEGFFAIRIPWGLNRYFDGNSSTPNFIAVLASKPSGSINCVNLILSFSGKGIPCTLHGAMNIQSASGLLVEGVEIGGVSHHFGNGDSPTYEIRDRNTVKTAFLSMVCGAGRFEKVWNQVMHLTHGYKYFAPMGL